MIETEIGDIIENHLGASDLQEFVEATAVRFVGPSGEFWPERWNVPETL